MRYVKIKDEPSCADLRKNLNRIYEVVKETTYDGRGYGSPDWTIYDIKVSKEEWRKHTKLKCTDTQIIQVISTAFDDVPMRDNKLNRILD